MSVQTECQKIVDEFRSRPTLRAGSLITTVFGDSIAPRGGTLWLGSLINTMADFGISERLVRTSVFRLVKDGWLQSRQIGRRSYYSLTDEGRERFEQATHRIYGEPIAHWDGKWCLLLLSGLDTATREIVRKECGWLGFGQMSANVLAHPSPDLGDLDVTIRRLGVDDWLVVIEGQTIRSESAMRDLARDSWNLDDLDVRYAEFVQRFRPVFKALSRKDQLTEQSAFLIRTLLIQEYRKVLLRDPLLPAELLPPGWHGVAAYQLCRNLYRAVQEQSDAYLDHMMETADGPLPPPSQAFMQRFGGLERLGKVSTG
jgi:phenylacetic acid degradation operon negative regulatory protein